MTPARSVFAFVGPRFRAALLAAGLLFGATAASAQEGGVTVNPDILNNLDWAAAVAARGGFAARGEAGLLPPPPEVPESGLLIRPEPVARQARLAATPPPARKPIEVADQEPAPDEPRDVDPGAVARQALAAAEARRQPAPAPPPPPAAAVETAAPPAPEPPAPEPPAPASSAARAPERVIAALPPPEPPPPEPSAPKAPAEGATPGETGSAALEAPLAPLARIRLPFESGSADLDKASRAKLEALAEKLLAEPARRVEVRAYAARAAEAQPSDIRRLSLSRALAVRSFLTDKGVAATRIDLRPLGETAGSGPADRADIVDASG